MQIKPFFSSYQEHFRIPVVKDDRGVQYSLVSFTGIKRQQQENWEEVVNGVRVLSDELQTWSNGATSYDERLYWKLKEKDMNVLNIDNFVLTEVSSGSHCMPLLCPNKEKKSGLATEYKVTKL